MTPGEPPRSRAGPSNGALGPQAHRVLGLILVVLFAALPAIVIGEWWVGTAKAAELAVLTALWLGIAVLVVLHRRGRDRRALVGLLTLMVAGSGLLSATYGSVRGVGTLALVGAIVCAGTFLGRTALLAMLGACSALVGSLIVGENAGWLPRANFGVGLVQWFEYTALLAVIALAVWYARATSEGAMRRAFEGEAWLGSVLRNAPSALVATSLRDGRIRQVNAAYERTFGVRREEAVGRTSVELGLWSDADRQAFAEAVRRSGSLRDHPMRVRRANGEALDVLLSGEIVEAGGEPLLIVAVVDVTEQVRIRRALQVSETRFRKLFEDSPVASAIFTPPQGRFVDCNDAYVALVGRPREAIVGRTARELGIWRDFAGRERAWQTMQREGVLRDQAAELVRGDGSTIHCLFSWVSIELDGEPLVLAQVVDISARLQAEQALRELNEQLEQRVRERTGELAASNAALAEARDAAEAATRAKSQFLANMSHEIRTPLNAIVGLTGVALRTPGLGAPGEGHLRHVERAAMTLLEIVNQVLDFSKIEAGQLALERQPFALDQLLASVQSVVGMAAAANGLELRLQMDPEVARQRLGDALRLGQVLTNLAGNAVKFTERGRVTLAVSDPGTTVDGVPRLRFAVHDTGIGIPAQMLPRLFRPFDQLDASMTRRFGGTGLGLAISHELVRQMGGELTAHSGVGSGSTFAFELPLPLAEPHEVTCTVASAAATPASLEAQARALQGRRILLAEDNEVNCLVAREFLEGLAGARLHVVGTGAEALQALESEPFDLVLMDVQMPVMDGYEATRRLRQDPRHAALPVIAMTAHAQPSDRERSREAGMNGHIDKPFDAQELFRTLAEALRPPVPPGPPGQA